jgi:hypothetical protein
VTQKLLSESEVLGASVTVCCKRVAETVTRPFDAELMEVSTNELASGLRIR